MSAVGEQLFYGFFIGFVNQCIFAEIALPFAGFFGQNVALKSFFTFNLTAAGNLKTLFSTTVRFHFRHFVVCLIPKYCKD